MDLLKSRRGGHREGLYLGLLVIALTGIGCGGERRVVSQVAPYSQMIGHVYRVADGLEALGIQDSWDGRDGAAYVSLSISEPPYRGSEVSFRRPVAKGLAFTIVSAEMLDTILDDSYYYVVEFEQPLEPGLPVHVRPSRFGSDDGRLNPKYFELVK